MQFSTIISILISKISKSDIGKRMAAGAMWSFSGTAFAKLIVLISGIFCAHILGKQEYGELGMVRSTINMFVMFGIAGLGVTATKHISQYLHSNKDRICSIYLLTNGVAMITGIIVTSLILFLAPYLADNMLNAPYLTNAIRVGAILLFVTVINGAQNGTLAGFEDFKHIALNNLIGSIAESLFMIIGAQMFGVIGAILGYGCGFIALYFANNISIRKKFREENITIKKELFNHSDLKLLYKFSLPAVLSSLLIAPSYWIVKSILVKNYGFSELAIYEASDQWKVIILFIPSAVSNIVLPILSSVKSNEGDKFRKILYYNLLINASIAFVLATFVSLLSPYIMQLYGKDYDDYWTIIILAYSTVFSTIANVVGHSLISKAKVWYGFFFNFGWAAYMIILSYLFIQMDMGAKGIALAILLSYIIHGSCQLFYMINITKDTNNSHYS